MIAISVLDINDNAPTFLSTLHLNIPENLDTGSEVCPLLYLLLFLCLLQYHPLNSLQVVALLALDSDLGHNGTITYNITSFQHAFSINGKYKKFPCLLS